MLLHLPTRPTARRSLLPLLVLPQAGSLLQAGLLLLQVGLLLRLVLRRLDRRLPALRQRLRRPRGQLTVHQAHSGRLTRPLLRLRLPIVPRIPGIPAKGRRLQLLLLLLLLVRLNRVTRSHVAGPLHVQDIAHFQDIAHVHRSPVLQAITKQPVCTFPSARGQSLNVP